MTAILRLSLPLTVWLIGFSAVYGVQGLSCSRHWPAALEARPILVATALVAVAVQVALLYTVWRRPSPSHFVQATGMALAVAAIVASIWTLVLPPLVSAVCL